MKWFDRWFYKKAKWAWENKDEMEEDILVPRRKRAAMLQVEETVDWGDGLRINLKKVIGGYVVSFRSYDRQRDTSEEKHYIITDDQDFERELGKIITLESMKFS